MEHESAPLTADERRIVAELETALRGDERPPRREHVLRATGWQQAIAVTAVLVGVALLAGGLWFAPLPVAVGAAGLVVGALGLSRLAPRRASSRMVGRVRRWFGHDATRGGG